eukprot:TRINITY_DN66361_c8_g1_i1.p1 TRINITY_DN66361_c8_g1~~TRINITY_DN66361_c8_g1_i1.p1  ORF type:complete len:324 (-),score=159.52 TRINITY_DN66361_c8_g1_i1:100-1071(-)
MSTIIQLKSKPKQRHPEQEGNKDEKKQKKKGKKKWTKHFLSHCTTLQRGPSESWSRFFGRVTHLNLSGKALTSIEDYVDCTGMPSLSLCRALKVLYIYDNELERVENLEFATELESVFVQNNKLTRLDGFQGMDRLRLLHADRNRIAALEGLQGANELEELSLCHQQISKPMVLDVATLRAVAPTLKILKLAGCRLTSVAPLGELRLLKTLDVSGNELHDVADLKAMLAGCMFLNELDFTKNPLAKVRKIHNVCVVHAEYLATVNGRDVTDKERTFLLALHEKKMKKLQAARAKKQKQSGDAIKGDDDQQAERKSDPADENSQ